MKEIVGITEVAGNKWSWCKDALVLRRTRKAGTEFPPPYFLPYNHGLGRQQLSKCSWYVQFHLGNAESWKEHCSYTCNKKNWGKKQIDHFSWTHERTEVTGQTSNLKSGERRSPAGSNKAKYLFIWGKYSQLPNRLIGRCSESLKN